MCHVSFNELIPGRNRINSYVLPDMIKVYTNITFLLSELTILTCAVNEKSSENVRKNLRYYYDCIYFWWEILAKIYIVT